MSTPDTQVTGQRPAPAKTISVEWRVVEDDREWQLAQAATPDASIPMRSWGRHEWVATAIALLCLLAIGGWLWHEARAGLSQIEAELQAAVEADQWRAKQDSHQRTDSTRAIQQRAEDEQLPAGSHVQLLNLQSEWAVLRVDTMQGDLPYRQTHLYHRGVNGWYAVAPSADLWGEPRTLETTHFTFHYYALDAEAVAEAAAKLDALYPDLISSYPFDPIGDGKQEIWVSPEHPLAGSVNVSPETTLKVASPAIYLAPAEISEGDILAQEVLQGLLTSIAHQTLQHLQKSPYLYNYQISTRFLWGLGLWQLWSMEVPSAALHKPTVQWAYRYVPAENTLPVFDATLCALNQLFLNQLWRAAPYAIQVPLFCGEPQEFKRFGVVRFFPLAAPRSLAEIPLFVVTTSDEPSLGLNEAERVGMATVFDYAAATYGRESIATLITNTAFHSTWKTLIPATFGVTYDEFEAGWHAHLHAYYGVSSLQ